MSFPLVRTLLKNYILIFRFYFTSVWRTFTTFKVSITAAIYNIAKKGFFIVSVALRCVPPASTRKNILDTRGYCFLLNFLLSSAQVRRVQKKMSSPQIS